MDYIRKIKADPIARAVKIADLMHNSDLTRLRQGTSVYKEAEIRCKKYAQALAILAENAGASVFERNGEQ